MQANLSSDERDELSQLLLIRLGLDADPDERFRASMERVATKVSETPRADPAVAASMTLPQLARREMSPRWESGTALAIGWQRRGERLATHVHRLAHWLAKRRLTTLPLVVTVVGSTLTAVLV